MESPILEELKSEEKNSRIKLIGLIVLIIVLLSACGWVTYKFIVPMAEPLFVKTTTPEEPSIDVQEPEPSEEPAPSEEPEPAAGSSACRQTGTMSFLVAGVDAPYTDEPKGADAIRLVHLDFSASEVTVVALPRDLWISTPALEALEISADRLGLTYYYAKENNPANTDEVVYGTTILAQTIYDNFGFVPDHYITLHISKFADIVDAMGGVEVTIPKEFKSKSYLFPPGLHVLDGDQALEYASNLPKGTEEWDRLDRQDLILKGVYDKLTSPNIILSIPNLISEFSDTVTTDLSVLDMTDLSCLMDDVSAQDIIYVEVEKSMVTKQADSGILQPNYGDISNLLKEIFE